MPIWESKAFANRATPNQEANAEWRLRTVIASKLVALAVALLPSLAVDLAA